MKSKVVALVVSLAACSALNSSAQSYQPGELIVRFKEGPSVSSASVKSLYQSLGVRDVQTFSPLMGRLQTIKLNPGVDTISALQAAQRDPRVERAQLNYILTIPEKSSKFVKTAKKHPYSKQLNLFAFYETEEDNDQNGGHKDDRPKLERRPDLPSEEQPDEMAKHLWGLKTIQARAAWDNYPSEFKYNMTVAVIDTGIDYNHEDLGYNLWRKKSKTTGKEFVGYDFIHDDELPYDDQGHGTHTAGTIGAVGYNGIGVLGVAPAVNVMSLKFLGGKGGGTTADAVRAIDYAVTHGAKVLSNSWGGPGEDDNAELKEAIIRAEKKNVLFIVAAGNEETNNDTSEERSYPASFKLPNLISVAASDIEDKKAYFSNFGPETTHIFAPGVNILSSVPGSDYKAASGTSMACPHVAGAAAMIWSLKPKWSYKQVRDILLKSVDKVDGFEKFVSSGGRLNLAKAVKEAGRSFNKP
ncbi:MAG: S8 family serine peptidase [Xanthomonadaceae bacterium]|nr:S8 family serine peptidase [Xanthomonadaceae bacterium]